MSLEYAILHTAVDPVVLPAVLPHRHERPALEFGIGYTDFKAPARVVESADVDAVAVLPITITLAQVPVLKPHQSVHAKQGMWLQPLVTYS